MTKRTLVLTLALVPMVAQCSPQTNDDWSFSAWAKDFVERHKREV